MATIKMSEWIIYASPFAKRFWVEYQLDPFRADYNMFSEQVVEGVFNPDILSQALDYFVQDHVLYNSHLVFDNEKLFWKKNDAVALLEQYDDSEEEQSRFINAPFNIEKGPLYRFGLFKISLDRYRLIIVSHHLLISGTAATTEYFTLISKYYNDLATNASHFQTQNKRRAYYGRSLSDQINRLVNVNTKLSALVEESKQSGSRKIWLDYLATENVSNDFPFSNSLDPEPKTGIFNFIVDKSIFFEKSGLERYTKFQIFMLVYGVLIARYCSSQHAFIYYSLNIKEGEGLIYGSQVNTLIFKVLINDDDTWLNLLDYNTKFIKMLRPPEGCKHSYLPTYDILALVKNKQIDIGFGQTWTQGDHLLFNFDRCINSDGKYNPILNGAKLFLEYQEDASCYHFRLKYRTDLLTEKQVEMFAQQYQNILNSCIYNPTRAIMNADILTVEQYQKIIYDWNRTEKKYSSNKTIHQLFEEQVIKTPYRIAVVMGQQRLTYQELNQYSNQLARYIRAKYELKRCVLRPDAVIALCLDRSLDLIIAVLGVLKAGAAYVPIDPRSPICRMLHILEDTKSHCLLTQKHFFPSLISLKYQIELIAIDDKPYLSEDVTGVKPIGQSNNLAYVIYTSGTTGKPKGVAIAHHSVVNRIEWMQNQYPITVSDKVLHKTPYFFDVSVWELFWANWYGATVFIAVPDGHANVQYLYKTILEEEITVVHFVPSMLSAFMRFLQNSELKIPSSLTDLFCSGEALSRGLVNDIKNSAHQNLRIHNLYGPTETSIDVTAYDCDEHLVEIYIGKPIQNTQVYVLDSKQNPVPIGVIGELYIGGVGLSVGYLNQPILTAQNFIKNKFDINKDSRLYKTGDLVKWSLDGYLIYVGRNDFQFKINGSRVEAAEIESALLMHALIKQCVLLCKEKNTAYNLAPYMVAYYTSEQHIEYETLVSHLLKYLPNHMIPNEFIHKQTFTLTVNGKIDRESLLKSDVTFNLNDYVAPRSALEEQMCVLWQSILNVERCGIDDDFFQMGGHSILAIQLVGRMNVDFDAQISVPLLFSLRTIKKLVPYFLENKGRSKYEPYLINQSFVSSEDYKPFPLNNVQQAYLYGRLSHFGFGNVSPHLYYELVFYKLDVDSLESAFNVLIQRHDALRTVFTDGKQGVLQYVNYYFFNRHHEIDEQGLLSIREGLSHKQYLPEHYPLFDIDVSVHSNKTIIHISVDLLIMDGSSFFVFMDEWAKLYNNKNVVLPEIQLTFRQYIQVYQQMRHSHLFEIEKRYWQKKLEAYDFDWNLPFQINPSAIKKPKFARLASTIPTNTWSIFVKKAESIGVGVTSALLTVYGLVLLRWSNQKNICINVTLFNRMPLHPDINSVLGDFTALELFHFSRETTQFDQQVRNVHTQLWEDIEHNLFDGIDFQRLVRKHHQFDQNKVLSPLVFSSILGQQKNMTLFDGFDQEGEVITQTPQICLDNQLRETASGLLVAWDYVEQLFERHVIEEMHQDYCDLIQHLTNRPWSCDISELYCRINEQTVIRMANQATQECSIDTLVSLFEKRAALQPNDTAVIYKQNTYDYKFIKQNSDIIASKLYLKGEPRHKLIAILSEKGYQQVVASLGIMKVGTAYLPLNIDWPIERIKEIMQLGSVKRLLMSRAQWHIYKGTPLVFNYDVSIIEEMEEADCSDVFFPPKLNINDAAYVIFTSGSTGKPKGVTISHQSVVNSILAVNTRFKINKNDRVLAISDLSFDLSVYDIFGILAHGGAIVFPEQERLKSPEHWYQLIHHHQITIWNSVPQLMKLLLDYIDTVGLILSTLKVVLLSGDWIPLPLANHIKFHNNKTTVMSLGGATEGSIWSVWYEIDQIDPKWSSIPYGHAMPNQKIYVLNLFGEHCPAGVVGDIYIGGIGVALGYWNDHEKTVMQFIIHPQLGRLYKTGDRGRWHEAKYVEFLGRQDSQIKRHGYRVELDEIAVKLEQQQHVETASVRLFNDRMVAYIISKKFQEISLSPVTQVNQQLPNDSYIIQKELEDELRSVLARYLPHYMLPDIYIGLYSLPLTSNGKLDYQALPIPEFVPHSTSYVSPRNEIEAKICLIWQDILGLDQIGVNDDFFMMGGDSINSIQVASKLRYENIDCHVKDLFEYRTAEQLADYLAINKVDVALDTEQGLLTGCFGLSSLQHWFFSTGLMDDYQWNQSYLVRTPPLKMERLNEALSKLVMHHDMLRVRFVENDNGIVEQRYEEEMDYFPIEPESLLTLLKQDHHFVLDNWKNKFNWRSEPLWRIGYLDGYEDGDARLLLTFHHLIADPVSAWVLIADLRRLYEGQKLHPKRTSYRQYQRATRHYVDKNPNEIDYWLQLGLDRPREHWNISADTPPYDESFILDTVLTQQLMKQANQAYHTEMTDLLLSSLSLALSYWSGNTQQLITLMTNGREWPNDNIDVSETVGWFTTMYPVKFIAQTNLSASILHVKEQLRSIPNNGIGYGALAYQGNQTQIHLDHLPPIHFGYLGQFQEGYWQPITENLNSSVHPNNVRNHILAVHSWVIGGSLHVHFSLKFDKHAANALIKLFKSSLIDVITHCMKQVANKQFVYTRGDFKLVKTETDLKTLPLYHDTMAHYEPFPMSDLQKAYALGRLNSFEIGNVANHFYKEFSFKQLDAERLERALNVMIAQEPVMRLVFDPYHLTQRYLPNDLQTYYRIEMHRFDGLYNEQLLIPWRKKKSHHVFDISSYPLFHLSLSQFDDRVILHFSFDMLLFDLKTVLLFYRTLTQLYQDEKFFLPKNTVTYRDYQCYMDMLKSSVFYNEDQGYWKERIKELPLRPALLLACDPLSIQQSQFKFNNHIVSASTWNKFKLQADHYGISYGAILLSLYGFVLSSFSETQDFLITVTLLNRYNIHPDVERLWGDFTSINLFGFSNKARSALAFFKTTHNTLWQDMEHSLYTGLMVQRDLMALHQLNPNSAVSPIVFTSVLGQLYENTTGVPYFLNQTEVTSEGYLIGQTSQAWIDLQVMEHEGNFHSSFLYVSQLFPDPFMDALNHQYCELIEYLAEQDWHAALPTDCLFKLRPFLMEQNSHNGLIGYQVQPDSIVKKLLELTGADQVFVHQKDPYIVAYLCSEKLHKANSEKDEISTFKIAEKGTRNDLNHDYDLILILDERFYRCCKSYRRFVTESLPDAQRLILDPALGYLSSLGRQLDAHDLSLVFAPLSAMRFADKLLPKYLYPSAGHSYSVQCYLHVPAPLDDLHVGIYYYHPLLHTLQRAPDATKFSELCLEFRVYRPGIDALYPREWISFSYIELGHMLYLISDVLSTQGIGYEIELNVSSEVSLESEHVFLGRLIFCSHSVEKNNPPLNLRVLHRDGQLFRSEMRTFDLEQQNLLMKISAVGQVLTQAQGLVIFEGNDDYTAWVYAGFEAQRHMTHWQSLNVYSCPLALKPYDGVVYVLALGCISEDDKLLAESKPIKMGIDEALTTELKGHFPSYRLPDAYVVLKSLPLTSLGKIDYDALPVPDLISSGCSHYVPPQSELETQMCMVWQEVLGVSKIGITDDFFRIGGDSILSMQITSRLRQLGVECTVKTLFESRCIRRLAEHIQPICGETPGNMDNDGADCIFSDISSELIKRLQARYEPEIDSMGDHS